ncbi:MAG TPA: hypothetical protein VM553_19600 [Dongiaceae bacterium]|nr:hypothetical protein [Dongiaceae bacterium]
MRKLSVLYPLRNAAVWAVIVGTIIGVLLTVFSTRWLLFDDAYIHARIARNLLEHGEPFFNLGVRFKADSSTGFLLLLTLFSYGLDFISAIRTIEGLAIVATTVALALLIYLNEGRRLISIAAAVGVMPAFLLCAYGGMETSVACALLAWATLAMQREQYRWAVVLIAVSAAVRIELALLLGLVLFHLVRHKGQGLAIIAWALPFVAVCALDLIWFGGVLPHAAKAKALAYGYPLEDSIRNGLHVVRGHAAFAGFVVACLIAAYGIIKGRLRPTFQEVLLVFCAVLFTVWVTSRSMIFEWYLCLLSFPLGLALLSRQASATPIRTLATLFALGGTAFHSYQVQNYLGPANTDGHVNLRVPYYLAVGSGLEGFCPTCTLATTEVGGLGYGFKGKVWDALGLGDPEAARFHPMKVPDERADYGIGAFPPAYVGLRNPDFVVTLDFYSEALQRSEFLHDYRLYLCPFPPELTIYAKKSGVKVYARMEIPSPTLKTMGCEESAAWSSRMNRRNGLHQPGFLASKLRYHGR